MEYELLPEYISAIFIAMYIVNSLLDSKVSTLQDILYRISLYVTLATIVLSVVTAYSAMHMLTVAHGLNVALHSAYFAFAFLMITMLCLAGLSYMFEGFTDTKRFRHFFYAIVALYALSLVVVLLNLRNGWLFRVDAEENYIRGPYNAMTYVLLLTDVAVIIVAYFLERSHVKRAFKRIAITLPIIASVMAIYQVLFRDTLLTGAIATLALTTLLIYGQQQRIHIDHLTALAGREMFYKTLDLFARRRLLFCVIFISLRDYKAINNRFGQLVGDAFLRVVSDYLGGLDRRVVACRYSGVEFALILPNFVESEYKRLFDTLSARFDEPWECDGNCVTLSASIVGIAYPEHAKSINELIDSLEYAVRQAKAEKRGRVIHFDSRLRNNAGRFHYVLSQMTDTPDDRFFVVFQPVHDSKSGLPCGAEALVRLRDENGRTIMPGEFIPLAEESGYVGAIDWFVVNKACQFLSEHRDMGVEWISVNLTPLVDSGLVVEQALQLLEKYDLPASALKLEVTERLFSPEVAQVGDTMRQLRALGVGVYLDDFGTGYSNLYMTAKLPLECVKIDRTFVRDLETDEKARQFLRTLIEVLHGMGFSITVEGVETAKQRDIVRRMGADMIQGFYYAKPLLPEDFLEYMQNNLA